MAQTLGHVGDRDPSSEEHRGVGVAQVVKPDGGQCSGAGEAGERFADEAGVEEGAVAGGEHEAFVVPGGAGGEAVGGLVGPVASEHGDGGGVDVNRAVAVAGLGAADDDAATGGDDGGAADVQGGRVEVDVVPQEGDELATAGAGEEQEVEDGPEWVAGGVAEEGLDLGGGPDGHAAGCGFGAGVARGMTASRGLRLMSPLRRASPKALWRTPWTLRRVLADRPPGRRVRPWVRRSESRRSMTMGVTSARGRWPMRGTT